MRASRSAPRLASLLAVLVAACAHAPPKRPPAPQAAPPTSSSPASSSHGVPPPPTVREGAAPWAERDGGPPIPPDVSRVPEPVPRAEPRAAYGNKSPYTVLGRTYQVMPSSRGYVERGTASWYGTKFHGRLTSSREPYDMYQLTAAHKTLPLPTFARVTNLDNGRSIVVRINDRGPFHEGRIIDLSYAAAIKLGIHVRGTGRVEVRAIDPGDPDSSRESLAAIVPPPRQAPRPAAAPAPTGTVAARGESVLFQVGAFADKDNAKRLADRLEDADIDDVSIDRERVSGRRVYRVRVGPVRGRDAGSVQSRLARMGLKPVVVAR
ncbi:MAG TPA: septal ring lytic transglycosylase RlpA family protein [Xanthomonadales bacterium]|nr:septal ring lytic transglycosylase RlpA family protein [Xanthomonadales bacterium]